MFIEACWIQCTHLVVTFILTSNEFGISVFILESHVILFLFLDYYIQYMKITVAVKIVKIV